GSAAVPARSDADESQWQNSLREPYSFQESQNVALRACARNWAADHAAPLREECYARRPLLWQSFRLSLSSLPRLVFPAASRKKSRLPISNTCHDDFPDTEHVLPLLCRLTRWLVVWPPHPRDERAAVRQRAHSPRTPRRIHPDRHLGALSAHARRARDLHVRGRHARYGDHDPCTPGRAQ